MDLLFASFSIITIIDFIVKTEPYGAGFGL